MPFTLPYASYKVHYANVVIKIVWCNIEHNWCHRVCVYTRIFLTNV